MMLGKGDDADSQLREEVLLESPHAALLLPLEIPNLGQAVLIISETRISDGRQHWNLFSIDEDRVQLVKEGIFASSRFGRNTFVNEVVTGIFISGHKDALVALGTADGILRMVRITEELEMEELSFSMLPWSSHHQQSDDALGTLEYNLGLESGLVFNLSEADRSRAAELLWMAKVSDDNFVTVGSWAGRRNLRPRGITNIDERSRDVERSPLRRVLEYWEALSGSQTTPEGRPAWSINAIGWRDLDGSLSHVSPSGDISIVCQSASELDCTTLLVFGDRKIKEAIGSIRLPGLHSVRKDSSIIQKQVLYISRSTRPIDVSFLEGITTVDSVVVSPEIAVLITGPYLNNRHAGGSLMNDTGVRFMTLTSFHGDELTLQPSRSALGGGYAMPVPRTSFRLVNAPSSFIRSELGKLEIRRYLLVLGTISIGRVLHCLDFNYEANLGFQLVNAETEKLLIKTNAVWSLNEGTETKDEVLQKLKRGQGISTGPNLEIMSAFLNEQGSWSEHMDFLRGSGWEAAEGGSLTFADITPTVTTPIGLILDPLRVPMAAVLDDGTFIFQVSANNQNQEGAVGKCSLLGRALIDGFFIVKLDASFTRFRRISSPSFLEAPLIRTSWKEAPLLSQRTSDGLVGLTVLNRDFVQIRSLAFGPIIKNIQSIAVRSEAEDDQHVLLGIREGSFGMSRSINRPEQGCEVVMLLERIPISPIRGKVIRNIPVIEKSDIRTSTIWDRTVFLCGLMSCDIGGGRRLTELYGIHKSELRAHHHCAKGNQPFEALGLKIENPKDLFPESPLIDIDVSDFPFVLTTNFFIKVSVTKVENGFLIRCGNTLHWGNIFGTAVDVLNVMRCEFHSVILTLNDGRMVGFCCMTEKIIEKQKIEVLRKGVIMKIPGEEQAAILYGSSEGITIERACGLSANHKISTVAMLNFQSAYDAFGIHGNNMATPQLRFHVLIPIGVLECEYLAGVTADGPVFFGVCQMSTRNREELVVGLFSVGETPWWVPLEGSFHREFDVNVTTNLDRKGWRWQVSSPTFGDTAYTPLLTYFADLRFGMPLVRFRVYAEDPLERGIHMNGVSGISSGKVTDGLASRAAAGTLSSFEDILGDQKLTISDLSVSPLVPRGPWWMTAIVNDRQQDAEPTAIECHDRQLTIVLAVSATSVAFIGGGFGYKPPHPVGVGNGWDSLSPSLKEQNEESPHRSWRNYETFFKMIEDSDSSCCAFTEFENVVANRVVRNDRMTSFTLSNIGHPFLRDVADFWGRLWPDVEPVINNSDPLGCELGMVRSELEMRMTVPKQSVQFFLLSLDSVNFSVGAFVDQQIDKPPYYGCTSIKDLTTGLRRIASLTLAFGEYVEHVTTLPVHQQVSELFCCPQQPMDQNPFGVANFCLTTSIDRGPWIKTTGSVRIISIQPTWSQLLPPEDLWQGDDTWAHIGLNASGSRELLTMRFSNRVTKTSTAFDCVQHVQEKGRSNWVSSATLGVDVYQGGEFSLYICSQDLIILRLSPSRHSTRIIGHPIFKKQTNLGKMEAVGRYKISQGLCVSSICNLGEKYLAIGDFIGSGVSFLKAMEGFRDALHHRAVAAAYAVVSAPVRPTALCFIGRGQEMRILVGDDTGAIRCYKIMDGGGESSIFGRIQNPVATEPEQLDLVDILAYEASVRVMVSSSTNSITGEHSCIVQLTSGALIRIL